MGSTDVLVKNVPIFHITLKDLMFFKKNLSFLRFKIFI